MISCVTATDCRSEFMRFTQRKKYLGVLSSRVRDGRVSVRRKCRHLSRKWLSPKTDRIANKEHRLPRPDGLFFPLGKGINIQSDRLLVFFCSAVIRALCRPFWWRPARRAQGPRGNIIDEYTTLEFMRVRLRACRTQCWVLSP